MGSLNNNRKYNGTTEIDSANSLRHTFEVRTGIFIGRYEVIFTEEELASIDSVCKAAMLLSCIYPAHLNDFIDLFG